MKALIVEDGLSRQALAGARALAQAGWTVGVAEQVSYGVTACSRAVAHRHRVPAPNSDPDGFVEAVRDAVEAEGYEVVFGARDVDVLQLSLRRDEIGAAVPYPPHENVVRAMDKESLYAAAERVGMAAPQTWEPTNGSLEACDLPVIVKARLHASANGSGSKFARLETRPANTRHELRSLVAEMRDAGGEPLLQEWVAGRLLELSVLCDRDSRVVAHVQQEVDAVWPFGAGVAVRARSVATDPELLEQAKALAADLGWWGIAELQFMVAEGGPPRLVDFNGRFYGSLALAVAAGVNTPAMWAAMATGRPLPVTGSPTVGCHYQWLFGDLRRSIGGGRGGRLRDALGTLAYARGAAQSVFAARDPLPAARYVLLVLAGLFA